MLKRLFILALTVSTFSTAMAGPQEVQKAKEAYLKLFIADQDEMEVRHHSDEVVSNLFGLESGSHNKEVRQNVESFSEEITRIDLAQIVKKQRLSEAEMPAYADLMSRRLVSLGLDLDVRSRGVSSGLRSSKLRGAIIGAAAGFVLARLALGKGNWTNVNGSQDDLGSLLILGFSTGAGIGFDKAYVYLHKKYEERALKSVLKDLEGQAKMTLEQLKQSKSNKLVNGLE